MPEKVNDIQIFSLAEVAKSIQKTISERYKNLYWIKAELNKLNLYKQSGHCFPELVEKQEGRVVTQMKSIIWKDDFIVINNKFLSVLNEPLKDGIKILFLAGIYYDPAYGLSLHIVDIDPAYTLGDLEKEKQETIMRLELENLFDRNKTLQMPLLPQRIAIISVESSKGYADFLKVIDNHPRKYKFFHLLFPSLLQGEKAVVSIISQLRRIKKVKNHFDVVAIIRGGGDDIGLSYFNHYTLAREVALFPIPVITGIGHATNETVTEMISFSNAITPTKLAEYLLQIFNDFADPVQKAAERMVEWPARMLVDENRRLQSEVKWFQAVTDNILLKKKNEMKLQLQSLFQQAVFRFRNEKTRIFGFGQGIRSAVQRKLAVEKENSIQLHTKVSVGSQFILKNRKLVLENLERHISNMSPHNVLKRGFSITRLHGKAVKNFEEVKEGDVLQTIIFEGQISSIVGSSFKQNKNE
jgi:exodeoxyribonuclease VII large subunit